MHQIYTYDQTINFSLYQKHNERLSLTISLLKYKIRYEIIYVTANNPLSYAIQYRFRHLSVNRSA